MPRKRTKKHQRKPFSLLFKRIAYHIRMNTLEDLISIEEQQAMYTEAFEDLKISCKVAYIQNHLRVNMTVSLQINNEEIAEEKGISPNILNKHNMIVEIRKRIPPWSRLDGLEVQYEPCKGNKNKNLPYYVSPEIKNEYSDRNALTGLPRWKARVSFNTIIE